MANSTALPKSNPRPAAKALRSVLDFFKRHRNQFLLILSIVLILLAAVLVYELVTQAFTRFFKCDYLMGPVFKFLCAGVSTPGFHILGPIDFLGLRIPSIDFPTFSILPRVDVHINPPLENLRKIVVWSILLAFGVLSLVLSFIVIKIKGFVKLLMTPEGRKTVLTDLSIWLLIFAILCGLFYLRAVFAP